MLLLRRRPNAPLVACEAAVWGMDAIKANNSRLEVLSATGVFQRSGRDANDKDSRGHILRYHGTRADRGVIADRDAADDCGARADADMVADVRHTSAAGADGGAMQEGEVATRPGLWVDHRRSQMSNPKPWADVRRRRELESTVDADQWVQRT